MSALVLEFLKRRFGGVTPDLLLAPDEVATIKQCLKAPFRRFNILAGMSVVVLGALIGGGLIWLRLVLDGPAVNAVLDERPFQIAVFLGMASLTASVFVAALIDCRAKPRLAQRAGVGRDLYRCYYATAHGWLPSRSLVVTVILFLPVSVFFSLAGWTLGDRVDENGIARPGFPSRHIDPHTEVIALELYRAGYAPIGLVVRPSLIVRFRAGPEWTYSPDPRSVLPVPRQVADYIAARSGVTIFEGNISP